MLGLSTVLSLQPCLLPSFFLLFSSVLKRIVYSKIKLVIIYSCTMFFQNIVFSFSTFENPVIFWIWPFPFFSIPKCTPLLADTIKYTLEAVCDEWLAALFFTLYMQHLKLLPSSHAFLIHYVQHIFFRRICTLKCLHLPSLSHFHICKHISIKHIRFGRTDIKQTSPITFSAA